MTNPFEQTDATYSVLINDEKQYSLWPSIIAVPNGWNIILGEKSREECMVYINSHWLDMRPKSIQVNEKSVSGV